jgi:hypothetical protein
MLFIKGLIVILLCTKVIFAATFDHDTLQVSRNGDDFRPRGRVGSADDASIEYYQVSSSNYQSRQGIRYLKGRTKAKQAGKLYETRDGDSIIKRVRILGYGQSTAGMNDPRMKVIAVIILIVALATFQYVRSGAGEGEDNENETQNNPRPYKWDIDEKDSDDE